MKSSLREVYAHPVGHDILKKIMLQTGMQERLLDNRNGNGFVFLTSPHIGKSAWKKMALVSITFPSL